MQLSNDLVAFVDQIGPNCLDEVELAQSVGVSHFKDTVQLGKGVRYVVVVRAENSALVAD
jgi:hypothetical protein